MKIFNNVINRKLNKVFLYAFSLGAFSMLTSCFEDEDELFYQTTVAAFSESVNEDTLEVEFTNNSAILGDDEDATGDVTYMWDFGDDSTTDDTSTEENPTYTYSDEGSYEVVLVVTDVDGAESSATRTIEVSDGVDTEAIFEYSVTTTGSYIFNNLSTDAETYAWDFGDGSEISEEFIPEHTYSDAGDYTVTLVVTSSHGVESTATEAITVE